uniref:Calcineurin-like phosphoesterase n=1 Tax=viral metagenome TaxID=1070528 RepID=A0A6M3IGW1_9ZZZZ
MEVAKWTAKYTNRNTEFHLHCLGDIHAGTKHCAEEKIKAKVKEIEKDPFAFWIGMGDYGEFITGNDPRWDIAVISDWVRPDDIAESQREWIVNLFRPIARKGIGLLEGNHEDAMRTHFKGDVQSHLCKDLGLPNLGYSCFVRLCFNRTKTDAQQFKCHFQHGSGSAITEGGKIQRLYRGLTAFDAHIYGMGHVHDVTSRNFPYLGLADNDEIKDLTRAAAITGCWVRTYSQGIRANYAEKKGYSPSRLGSPVFNIRPFYREITVEG